MPEAKAYFFVLAFGLALLIGLGGANALVDPYLIYGSPRIEGVNLYKTRFFFGQYQAKPRLVEAVEPWHLVIGTSTAGSSLRPSHPGFDGEPTFNYALAGSTPHVQSLALGHAIRIGSLRSVILCVDLFAYNAFMLQPAFMQLEQEVESGGSARLVWRHMRRELERLLAQAFNWHPLTGSLETILDQRQPGTGGVWRDLHDDGFWANPRPVGFPQALLFESIERQYLSTGWFPEPTRRFGFEDHAGRSTLAELRGALLAAKQAGVNVTIAVMPFHARFAEAMFEVGLWDDFDSLKRGIVELTGELLMRDVHIWDFSGYHELSMDPVIDAAVDTPWFDDAIHPTAATGDRMLQRMLQAPSGEAEFGRLLEPATLEASLVAAVSRRAEYQARNPADVAQVRAIARETAAARVPPSGAD